jgi:hypothetical protein
VQKEKHRFFLVQKSAHIAGAFIFKTPHCVIKKHCIIFYTAQCNVYYSDFVDLSFKIAMSRFSFNEKFTVLSTESLSDEKLVDERSSSAR